MATKTYRHRLTGRVFEWPERAARHFPEIEEVKPDAKPLAYVPALKPAPEPVTPKSIEASPEPAPAKKAK